MLSLHTQTPLNTTNRPLEDGRLQVLYFRDLFTVIGTTITGRMEEIQLVTGWVIRETRVDGEERTVEQKDGKIL